MCDKCSEEMPDILTRDDLKNSVTVATNTTTELRNTE